MEYRVLIRNFIYQTPVIPLSIVGGITLEIIKEKDIPSHTPEKHYSRVWLPTVSGIGDTTIVAGFYPNFFVSLDYKQVPINQISFITDIIEPLPAVFRVSNYDT